MSSQIRELLRQVSVEFHLAEPLPQAVLVLDDLGKQSPCNDFWGVIFRHSSRKSFHVCKSILAMSEVCQKAKFHHLTGALIA
jgi:DNA replication protein DnaC